MFIKSCARREMLKLLVKSHKLECAMKLDFHSGILKNMLMFYVLCIFFFFGWFSSFVINITSDS